MDNSRTALVRRPAYCDDIEASGVFEQMVLRKNCQGQIGEPALLFGIDRKSRSFGVDGRCRTHFDENDDAAIECDDIEFAAGQFDIPCDDAIAELSQESGGRSFRSITKPSPPNGPTG